MISAQEMLNFVFCFAFLGLHLQHMEVPRLGVKSELQLLVYATATATWDPSCVCDVHHSSRQCQILNPLSEARDRTRNLMVPSWICLHCATMGTLMRAEILFCDVHCCISKPRKITETAGPQ